MSQVLLSSLAVLSIESLDDVFRPIDMIMLTFDDIEARNK